MDSETIIRQLASEPDLRGAALQFRAAVSAGRVDDVHLWLAQPRAAELLETATLDGSTPLLVACKAGEIKCAEMLLQAGANPFARNLEGYPANYYRGFPGAHVPPRERLRAERLFAAYGATWPEGDAPRCFCLRFFLDHSQRKLVGQGGGLSPVPVTGGRSTFILLVEDALAREGLEDLPWPRSWVEEDGRRGEKAGEGYVWLRPAEEESWGRVLRGMLEEGRATTAALTPVAGGGPQAKRRVRGGTR